MTRCNRRRQDHQKRRGLRYIFLFCGLCLMNSAQGEQSKVDPKAVPPRVAQTLLSPEKMREDLDYTVKILRNVHPATYQGFSNEQQAVIDAAYRRIQQPTTVNVFYFIVNSVICSLRDGHTILHPPGDSRNRRIDVPIIWLHDGFYVQEHREPFRQGDQVVAIGGKSIAAIYQQMRAVIPAENEHYRKWSMAEKIQREEFLDHLGVIANDAVEIGVERAGNRITLSAPLKLSVRRPPGPPWRWWVGYQIDPNLSLGVFHLDTCRLNDQYTKTVRSFFTEVGEKNIRNIAVDVRRNGGGNSRVVDEFFKYLKIDQYKSYGGDVRYSKEVAEKTGHTRTSGYERGEPDQRRNDKVEDSKLLFDGKLFVLTSTRTFSSGNWFAVMVKDNALGTIVGEPTGNAPSCYGDVPSFQMPNAGFWFSVSHKKFVRPDPDKDPADALYPDIPVYTTIEDVIRGADPQLERLKAILKEGSR